MKIFMTRRVPEQPTQAETVLAHLMRYKQITSIEAIHKYGITRLAACIYKLRDDHVIHTEEGQNAKGGTHAIYKLVPQNGSSGTFTISEEV